MNKRTITITALLIGLCCVLPTATAQDAEPPAVQNLDEAFLRAAKYQPGSDAPAWEYIIDEVMRVQQLPEEREALADRLVELMRSDCTLACKRFCVRQLQVIGSTQQMEALAPLLADPDLSHYARYAFQATLNYDNWFNIYLLSALNKTAGPVKIGIMNTLAFGGGTKVTDALAANLIDSDTTVAQAAAEGLGTIGTPKATQALFAALEHDLEPIEIELPERFFGGPPLHTSGSNFEFEGYEPRPPCLAPKGTVLVSRGKPVTSSCQHPTAGELRQITDGDKHFEESSRIELDPGVQWVQIDLGDVFDIYAIVVWHAHRGLNVYFDVVTKVGDDSEFETGITVFNNDHDDSAGLGQGKDKEYIENYEGRAIRTPNGVRGRFVRLYSNGSVTSRPNHYVEVEVFGKPAGTPSGTNAKATTTGAVRPSVIDSLLRCAHASLEAGDSETAQAIFERLIADGKADHVRIAALYGIAKANPKLAIAPAAAALALHDPKWQQAALGLVRTLPGEEATQAFMQKMDAASPELQALLLDALVQRADPTAMPALEKALDSEDESLRLAAIAGLAVLGDATTALTLAELAAQNEGKLAKAAQASLAKLPGENVDSALLDALAQPDEKLRIEIIRALSERQAQGAFDTLLAQAGDPNKDVRHAAFRAVGKLGQPQNMPALLATLAQAPSDDIRNDAASAVIALARRIPPNDGPAQAIVDAFDSRPSAPIQATLLQILGEVGDPASLNALRTGAKSADPAVQEAAINALAGWPNPTPLEDLHQLSKKAPTEKLQDVALKGYVDMLRMPNERAAVDTLACYQEAMKLANTNATKSAILSGLGEMRNRKALAFVESCMADESIRSEAAVAAERIRKHYYRSTASNNSDRARLAHDGDIGSRWDTAAKQQPGQWYQLDMGGEATVAAIHLDTSRSANDYPRAYEAYIFNDEAEMDAPIAKGEGDKAVLEIKFDPPTTGRYIRILQTGASENNYWSIHELRVIAQ